MASRSTQRVSAVTFSVLGHAAIVAALTFSMPLSRQHSAAPVAAPIEAVVIDGAAINAAIEQRKQDERDRQQEIERQADLERQAEQQRQAEEAERQAAEREAQAEQQRQAELKRQADERERLAEQQKQAEIARQKELELKAEQERQAELERQRQLELQAERERQAALEREAEARRAAEARAARIAEQQAQAIAAEEEARQARESGVLDQWARAISNRMVQFWRKPPSARPGIVCELVVSMIPTGEVYDVDLDESHCNGDEATRRSIETAVLEASPLPLPSVRAAFQSRIRIVFAPDE